MKTFLCLRSRSYRLATVVAVLAACISAASAKEAPTTKPKPYPPFPKITGLRIGDAAPDFKLPGVDGKTHTLAEYKESKVLAVIFTCNHCPASKMYEDAIIKLAADYSKKGLALVAISPNDPGALRPDEVAGSVLGDSFEEMKIRAKEKKYPFPYLYDGETQKAAIAYGATVTPQVFIFDKARKLRYTGAVAGPPYTAGDGPHAERAIAALLADQKVPYDSTRPFGCSTKWGSKRRGVDYDTAMWNQKPVTVADIDLAGVKKLAANDSNLLRLICVWSLKDKSCRAGFDDLVMLRRIYQHRPLELMTISVDPAASKPKVLKFLKAHHAAKPGPTRFVRYDPKAPVNFIFTGKDTAALFAALQAKAKTKDTKKAPLSVMVIPDGKVIHAQSGKLNPRGLRAKLVDAFRR